MEEHKKEIDAIVNNTEKPTFENTIVALDQAGELLNKVMYAFGGQSSVNTTDEIQALEQEFYPLLSAHFDDINLNPALFARVKAVYDQQASLNLDKEQAKLLEETYKGFVRGGANLDADKQAKLRELNEKISVLELTFGQNVLKETNAFKLVVDKKEDLAGLPESVIAAAAETAAADSMEGKWVFTLHNPSVMPFLQYADNRSLREKMFKAYINRGNNNNGNDNKNVLQITPDEFKQFIDKLKDKRKDYRIPVRIDENMMDNFTRKKIPWLKDGLYGCSAGRSTISIDVNGNIYPCSFLNYEELKCGNIKENSLLDIWKNSDVLNDFRNINELDGKCNDCEYKNNCQGGCRASAYAQTRSIKGEDGTCYIK